MVTRQAKSAGEETLWLWLNVFQPGLWQRELRFHETRRWRFDFAREDIKLAVEFDGLLYRGGGGGHQRVAGYEKDREKDAEALLLGWRVLRLSPGMLRSGKAYSYIAALSKTWEREETHETQSTEAA